MNYVGFPGEVIRFQLTNLQQLQADGTYAAVTAGATVAIVLVDNTGATAATGSVTNSGATWYADIALPATAGYYDARATAAKGGGGGDWVGTVQVKPFQGTA